MLGALAAVTTSFGESLSWSASRAGSHVPEGVDGAEAELDASNV